MNSFIKLMVGHSNRMKSMHDAANVCTTIPEVNNAWGYLNNG